MLSVPRLLSATLRFAGGAYGLVCGVQTFASKPATAPRGGVATFDADVRIAHCSVSGNVDGCFSDGPAFAKAIASGIAGSQLKNLK